MIKTLMLIIVVWTTGVDLFAMELGQKEEFFAEPAELGVKRNLSSATGTSWEDPSIWLVECECVHRISPVEGTIPIIWVLPTTTTCRCPKRVITFGDW